MIDQYKPRTAAFCPPCRTNDACGSAGFWCPLAPGSHKGLSSRLRMGCGVVTHIIEVATCWSIMTLGGAVGVINGYNHVYNFH